MNKDIAVGRKDGSLRMSRNNPFYSSLKRKESRADRYEVLLNEVQHVWIEIDQIIPDTQICP